MIPANGFVLLVRLDAGPRVHERAEVVRDGGGVREHDVGRLLAGSWIEFQERFGPVNAIVGLGVTNDLVVAGVLLLTGDGTAVVSLIPATHVKDRHVAAERTFPRLVERKYQASIDRAVQT